jgi:hypothetical protein
MKLHKFIIGLVGVVGIMGCSSPAGKKSATFTGAEVHWIKSSAIVDATNVEVDYISAFDSDMDKLLFKAVCLTHLKPIEVERISEWLVFTYPPNVGVEQSTSRREVISTQSELVEDTRLKSNSEKTIETEYVFAREIESGLSGITASYTVLLRLNEAGLPSRFVKAQVSGFYEAKKWRFSEVNLVE